MTKNLLLISVLLSLALACNIDDTDNGHVTVVNRAKGPVRVFYSKEVMEYSLSRGGEVVELDEKSELIEVGEEARLSVNSEPFFDGEIWVTYSGNTRRYDLDYDILGYEEIIIYDEDFRQ